MNSNYKIILSALMIFLSSSLYGARIKDLANIKGVRTNQLVGYGLVVGLNGTGDSKAEFTGKSMVRMLSKLGMKLDGKTATSKNVAAVIVTATLPPFARSGNSIDITVSSIGDSKSLKGGTLVQTPLRSANQTVYAVAQGNVSVGFSAKGVHENVARIVNGAIIEKDLGEEFSKRKMYRLVLHNPDFTTSARLSKVINMTLAGKYSHSLDAGTIDLITPFSYEGKGVELLSLIESLEVNPDFRAKVVVNEKTGTVVVGNHVTISKVAISHGDLSLRINETGKKKTKRAEGDKDRVVLFEKGASVGEVVKSMNSIGVSPKDLISILQSIKAAGALQGDLEIL